MTENRIDIFLDYLSFQRKYSDHTVQAYRRDLEEFRLFIRSRFDESDPAAAKSAWIRNWVADLVESKRSPRTVNRKLSALNSFYTFLKRENLIDTVPVHVVKTLKTGKKLPSYIGKDEMDRLMDSLVFDGGYPTALRSMIVSMLYHTGMRRAELIGLKNNGVMQESGVIKVLGKRNKERIIPVGPELINHVNSFLTAKRDAGIESEWFFTLPNGKPLYPKFVYNTIKTMLGDYTLASRRSPHVLRHSFATHMLRNGADLNAIKELLGHSNLAATQIYTHNSIDHLKKVHKSLHPKS